MALMAGTSCWPRSVSEYSTEGGEVGFTSRMTTPLASRARSRAVNTLAETLGMSWRSSLKRRGPPLRFQMTFGVQAPPSTAMQVLSGDRKRVVSGTSVAVRVDLGGGRLIKKQSRNKTYTIEKNTT